MTLLWTIDQLAVQLQTKRLPTLLWGSIGRGLALRNRVRSRGGITDKLGLTSARRRVRSRVGCGRSGCSSRVGSGGVRRRISRAASCWVRRVGSWRRSIIRLLGVWGTSWGSISSRGGISTGSGGAGGWDVDSRGLVSHVGVAGRGGIVLGRRVRRVLVLGNNGDSLDDGLGSHGGSVPAATNAGEDGEEKEEDDDGDDPVPVEVLFAESASDAVGSVGTIGGAGAPVDALLEVDDGALGEVGV